MTLAFLHVLQQIDPCAGMQRITTCGLNASRSMHHRNTSQSIGRRARNQYAVLALIVATCTTYRTTAATTLFVPFEEQTNGLPPHLEGLIHYMPQAAVTQPRQSPPPPAPHSTQNPSARTSTLGSAGGTVATSMPVVGAATPPTGRGSVGVSPTLPLLLARTSWFHPYDRSSSSVN